jgi:hypothetical protein
MENLYYRKVNIIETEVTPVGGYDQTEEFLSFLQDTCDSYWRSDDGDGHNIEVDRSELVGLVEDIKTMSVSDFNDKYYLSIEDVVKGVGAKDVDDLAQMLTDIAEKSYQNDTVVYLDIF